MRAAHSLSIGVRTSDEAVTPDFRVSTVITWNGIAGNPNKGIARSCFRFEIYQPRGRVDIITAQTGGQSYLYKMSVGAVIEQHLHPISSMTIATCVIGPGVSVDRSSGAVHVNKIA